MSKSPCEKKQHNLIVDMVMLLPVHYLYRALRVW